MKKNICEMGIWNYLKLARWRDADNLGNLYTEEIFQRKSHKSCRQKKEIPDKKNKGKIAAILQYWLLRKTNIWGSHWKKHVFEV